MRTLTIGEAQDRLAELIAEAHQGAVIVLTDGARQVWLDTRKPGALEEDTEELEAELLESVDGPFSPYTSEEMQTIASRLVKAKLGK